MKRLSILSNTICRSFSSKNTPSNYQNLKGIMEKQLDEIRQAGTFKIERVISSQQDASIKSNGQDVLNFCANNYLGLANNKRLIEEGKRTLDKYGFGMSSVRFICGTLDLHKALEKKISEFHGTEDTILYPSAFDANGGFFEAVLNSEDAVISDELNHASIIDGIRLCKAQRFRYKHLNMEDLEKILKETQNCRIRMIVTDGVFSMDGDVAPLNTIVDLAKQYKANIFIDECHSTGVFGKTGRGTPEYFGVEGEIDVINSTLGKALGGGTGGYSTGRKEIIDLLRQKGRPYLFSNTIAPVVAGSSLEVFNMIENETALYERLRANTKRFREKMQAAGFEILGNKECPIAPVYLKDAKLTVEFADEMLKHGIYVIGFSYPVVPKGHARIRVQLSAAHTPEQIDRCVNAFIDVGKKKGIIN